MTTERTTGATAERIDRVAERLWDECADGKPWGAATVDSVAYFRRCATERCAQVVDAGERIVSVADLAALVRKAQESPNPTRESEALIDRIRVLIGGN